MLNHRQTSPLILLIAILCFGSYQSAAFGDIVVSYALTKAEVNDEGSSTSTSDSFNLSGDTVMVTLPGFSSTTASVLSSTGLSNTFSHSRAGDLFDYSLGRSYVEFTANANDAYTINGSFSNSVGYTLLAVHLYDLTLSAYVFHNEQGSIGGTTFTLGGTAGNDWNILAGNLTGSLIMGNNYRWSSEAWTQAQPSPDSGSIASGTASLQLSSVPEPTSLALFTIFGISTVLYRRRKN
jgi:hypothetical protein